MNDEYQQMLLNAQNGKYILGAFNVFNHISAKAVVKAAEELDSPVIIEMSTSVVKKIGIHSAINLLNTVKEEARIPVIIHLDHCAELDIALECIDNGWKSIMFDGSGLSLEENIKQTKQIVTYAKKQNVHVEGEVGVIKGTEDDIHSDVSLLASFEDTMYFIEQTGVNTIAPAIGTAHGQYNGTPHINYELIERLANHSSCPVVIHGGTGLPKEAYEKFIKCGASKLNISTAIKHAYIDAIVQFSKKEKIVYEPLKADEEILNAIKEVVKEHIMVFNQFKK